MDGVDLKLFLLSCSPCCLLACCEIHSQSDSVVVLLFFLRDTLVSRCQSSFSQLARVFASSSFLSLYNSSLFARMLHFSLYLSPYLSPLHTLPFTFPSSVLLVSPSLPPSLSFSFLSFSSLLSPRLTKQQLVSVVGHFFFLFPQNAFFPFPSYTFLLILPSFTVACSFPTNPATATYTRTRTHGPTHTTPLHKMCAPRLPHIGIACTFFPSLCFPRSSDRFIPCSASAHASLPKPHIYIYILAPIGRRRVRTCSLLLSKQKQITGCDQIVKECTTGIVCVRVCVQTQNNKRHRPAHPHTNTHTHAHTKGKRVTNTMDQSPQGWIQSTCAPLTSSPPPPLSPYPLEDAPGSR